MKKLLLILLTFISLTSFAQMHVKEGSFRQIDGFVMLDKNEHYDDNNYPMALIKISTENISAEERRKITFKGNLETYFDVHFEPSEIYLYISTCATFIEIHHPDYGKTEYWLPQDLKGFCGYEMVVQYEPLVASFNESMKPRNNFLTITCDQDNAAVYIDDEYVGDKNGFKSLPIGSTHTWRIECDLYHTESGNVTITEGQLIIDKTLRPAFGFLNVKSTPENGAIVYVNNKRVGETPYTSERLASGSYKVRVVKEMYKTSEQTFVVNDGKTTNAVLNMTANFVNVTINTDSQSDIYVDEELKGKGKWSGRLSEGAHLVEARKMSHTSTFKEVNLTAGMTEVINVESPKPIYGYLEISSDPILADIYIDGKHCGQTPKVIYDLLVGEHELKLSKQGCAELKKNIVIKEGETLVLNEKLQTGKEISISTDQYGDKIYVDGNYIGISPITSTLSYGLHAIKAERNGKTVSKNINVVQGGDSSVKLTFFGNQTITVNGVSFTMIAVEGGTFQMGATSEQGSDADSDEEPVHNVTLSDYYIGETEVTQELWQAVMGKNPSEYKGNKKPVEQVSWNDCQEFVKKLNQLTGKNFRLPTEAEWEYAARGGKKSKAYKYSGSNTIDDVAWYYDNSSSKTHDVKTKQANELGIYDMSSNVWEWCQDWYGSYGSSSQTNPTGPSSGSRHVLRGGSWLNDAWYCRVSFRDNNFPDNRYNFNGFRLVL